MRPWTIAVLLSLLASPVSAQRFPPIMARDGWEAFRGIQYRGGDSHLRRNRHGLLVLKDSTLSFYRCTDERDCLDDGKVLPWKDEPYLTIPLSAIVEVTSSARSRGAPPRADIDDYILITYESAGSVEAPLFAIVTNEVATAEAKISFRAKRAGAKLAEPRP